MDELQEYTITLTREQLDTIGAGLLEYSRVLTWQHHPEINTLISQTLESIRSQTAEQDERAKILTWAASIRAAIAADKAKDGGQ